MDKLESISLFCQVVRLGSFTAVANERNVTQGSVSKKIAWLESQLRLTLLHRTSRKVTLTEQGREYYEYAVTLLETMQHTESRLRNELSEVSGELSLSAPSAFATQKLAAPIAEFLALNPNLSITVSVNDKLIDLANSSIDIAIRAAYLRDSGLIAKKLCEHQVTYFASPNYLEKHQIPLSGKGLEGHQCITYSLMSPSNVWLLDKKKHQVEEVVSSDSPEMIVKMATLGVGIAAMPRWMVEKELASGELIELLPDVERLSLPMYALYKATDYQPYRIRAFVDFLSCYFQTER